MIVIAGIVFGAIWGGLLAKRRKGNTFDIAHYAAGYGIVFGILGLFVTIFIERMF